MKIINENGYMKTKIESLKQACEVFKMRNPNWILTANKQEYRTLTVAVLSLLDMLSETTTKDTK